MLASATLALTYIGSEFGILVAGVKDFKESFLSF